MDKAKIEEEWDYEELKVIRERIFFKLRRENKLVSSFVVVVFF